ncbi:MAG: ribonuclease P protein component [Prevotella sp.]|nr:ribonuclease P protein component [Bacteroidales bacterium]MDY3842178.1 ribonuclease P protein component [Prevotella sp.]
MPSPVLTLTKEERICSKKLIEALFAGNGSRSMTSYPIRAVFLEQKSAEGEPPVQLLVSVPKRCFKRAVKRNRVKRQIREAFRRNKHVLADAVTGSGRSVAVALIWMSADLSATHLVETKVKDLLVRIKERL